MKTAPMEVRAIQWQASGARDVLDARLRSGAGSSRVHALDEPLEWNRGAWGDLARRRLKCGRSTPSDENWIGVKAFGTFVLVDCPRCWLAIEPTERCKVQPRRKR
jgi:hypothetical protein